MVFDPRDMATQGLFPGRTNPFSVSVMGHLLFEVDIEIIAPERAGGSAGTGRREKDKYRVTIRVSRKDRKWDFETTVSEWFANVLARFIGKKIIEPEVEVTSVTVRHKADPEIKVEKR